jgi:hypothetical protein
MIIPGYSDPDGENATMSLVNIAGGPTPSWATIHSTLKRFSALPILLSDIGLY